MNKNPCKDCTRKEEDYYGLVCAFWCTKAAEYSNYMSGYKQGLHELKSMDKEYGDGSAHIVCLECGFCKTCKDCECGRKK